jgi:hypothetical protein
MFRSAGWKQASMDESNTEIPQTVQTVSEFSRKQLVAIGMQPDYLVTDSSARVLGKSGEKRLSFWEGESAIRQTRLF